MKRRTAVYAGMLIMAMMGLLFASAGWANDVAPRITGEEVKTLLGNPNILILDARTGSSWSGSDRKIKGAVRVDPDDVLSWVNRAPREKKIIVYCS